MCLSSTDSFIYIYTFSKTQGILRLYFPFFIGLHTQAILKGPICGIHIFYIISFITILKLALTMLAMIAITGIRPPSSSLLKRPKTFLTI